MAQSSHMIDTQSTICSIYQEPGKTKEYRNRTHTLQSKNRFIITEEPILDYVPLGNEQKNVPAYDDTVTKQDAIEKHSPIKLMEKNNTSLSMTYSSVSSCAQDNAQSVQNQRNKETTVAKKKAVSNSYTTDNRKKQLVELERLKQSHYEKVKQ
jgi:hypothetical protein